MIEERAIFQATFSDIKIIKGRKVGQIVLELPLEGIDEALKALGGVPRPDREVWVVVAKLDPKAVQKPPEKPKRQLTPSQECALLCEEPKFRVFLQERRFYEGEYGCLGVPEDADEAAAWVREVCEVISRAEFDTDPEAAARWHKLHTDFKVWEKQ